MPRIPLYVFLIVVSSGLLVACDSGNEPEVHIEDLVIGGGAEANGRDIVTIDYVGTLKDGVEFVNSADWGPLRFQLESGIIYGLPDGQSGRVIQGLIQGVPGMRVGGVRRITIPPELGYGREDNGTIPPNSTLIFEVELVAIDEMEEKRT